jgi:diaminopimelate epimerase
MPWQEARLKIEFSKMSGAGNDFVCIDNRTGAIEDGSALARVLCDRRSGVGADGLLLLETSERADFKMMYFNADGSYGGMCGNGGRCIALFATKVKAATSDVRFEALDFVYSASVSEDYVNLMMKDPGPLSRIRRLKIGNRSIGYFFIDTGSPHVVIPIDFWSGRPRSLSAVRVEHLGRKIRHYDAFASEGVNVNFIQLSPNQSIHIRTYERGVEAETFACGTGSIAAAIVANKLWNLKAPITIIPRSSIPLVVEFEVEESKVRRVRLSGPARFTFSGSVDV